MASSSKITTKIALSVAGVSLLAVSYLYQHLDILKLLTGIYYPPEYHFIANRIFRILLNDLGMVMIIYAIFTDRNVVKLAVIIQLIDIVVLLPIYLLIKLPAEGVAEISSPFLSQFHRMIVNPFLMILLIPAIYYQKLRSKN